MSYIFPKEQNERLHNFSSSIRILNAKNNKSRKENKNFNFSSIPKKILDKINEKEQRKFKKRSFSASSVDRKQDELQKEKEIVKVKNCEMKFSLDKENAKIKNGSSEIIFKRGIKNKNSQSLQIQSNSINNLSNIILKPNNQKKSRPNIPLPNPIPALPKINSEQMIIDEKSLDTTDENMDEHMTRSVSIHSIYKVKGKNIPPNGRRNYLHFTKSLENQEKRKSSLNTEEIENKHTEGTTLTSEQFLTYYKTDGIENELKIPTTFLECFKSDENQMFKNNLLKTLEHTRNLPCKKTRKPLFLFNKLNEDKFQKFMKTHDKEVEESKNIVIIDGTSQKKEADINFSNTISKNAPDKLTLNKFNIKDVENPFIQFPSHLEKIRMKRFMKNFGRISVFENIESLENKKNKKSWNLIK